jgi:UDP-2-acetamido-2,6-beta-L-arabino-hexul-4-ose reductase
MFMKKIGITGQAGFVGTYLYNTLGLYPDKFERIAFSDDFFKDEKKLQDFVCRCDIIVHLAALNRHNDPQIIYKTNVSLVKQLISACEYTSSKPHILFSSSTQEELDNPYGRSKKEGRMLFEEWALRNNGKFTGFIIPNVFGPFGNPFYNSVVATFCYQLTHNETPRIDTDREINLVYVGELVNQLIKSIWSSGDESKRKSVLSYIAPELTSTINISGLKELLTGYKNLYLDNGEFPPLDSAFQINLFNTFLTYIDHSSFYPFKLKMNTDARGAFVETIKLHSGGQVSFSTTKPGITRGNHYHTRKAERFAVVKGRACIEIRRIGTNKVTSFILDGDQPSFVDMPVWFTHNITNIGDNDLFTIFWTNEHYNNEDPDTYFETVRL